MFKIYTDGSYSNKIKLGSYAFLILGERDEFIYGEACKITDSKWLKSWNIGPELIACLKGLEKFKELKLGEYVQILHDYVGVANWANHNWRAKLDYSKEYVKSILEYKKDFNLSFKKVKSHSGEKYNELVDKYTRIALKSGIDTPIQIYLDKGES